MNIEQKDTSSNGEFYYCDNGEKKALMTYRHTSTHQISIDHTEVNDSLKGQGVGHKLIEAAVKYARQNNLKIIPICPFVKSVIKSDSKFNDVVLKS